MDTYEVTFTMTLRGIVDVEASNEEEAKQLFDSTDTSPLFEDNEDFPVKWTGQVELIDWGADKAKKQK